MTQGDALLRDVLNGQITLNDVCPGGQVMEASPCDVHCVNDVVPWAQWANITSLRALASNIIVSEANNNTFAIAKHHRQKKRGHYG